MKPDPIREAVAGLMRQGKSPRRIADAVESVVGLCAAARRFVAAADGVFRARDELEAAAGSLADALARTPRGFDAVGLVNREIAASNRIEDR